MKMSFVVILVTISLSACAQRGPAPDSDICVLIPPHSFSERTIEHLRTEPGDRRWIVDVLKKRRCLCTADQQGCPSA